MSRAALLSASLLAAAYLLVATRGPTAVGLWVDDSIYLSTATSLAAGQGYRHAEIPGEPFQTKYPIAYPAVLALILRLAPEFPGNLTALLVPTSVAAAGFIVLCVLYWMRFFQRARREAVLLGSLAALSPALVSMLRFTMSDLLYAFLALAAITLLDRALDAPQRSRASLQWSLAAGLVMATAMLTRSIGVTLIAGSLGVLLWRRRWREAAGVLALAAFCMAPWVIWQTSAAQANEVSHASLLLSSELSYGAWTPEGVGPVLRVILHNAVRSSFGLLYFQLAIPAELMSRGLSSGSPWTLLLHFAGVASLSLMVIGFVVSARSRVRAVHACALPYAGLALAYPGDLAYRFLIPWTPFLLYFLVTGLESLCQLVARGVSAARGISISGRLVALPSVLLGVLLAVLFAREDLRILGSTAERYQFRVAPMSFSELRELEAEIKGRTAPDAIIASSWFASLYLSTGRQGYFPWPITDPFRLWYGPDREAWNFFLVPGEETDAHLDAEVGAHLAAQYRRAGVSWFVDHARMDPLARATRKFVNAHQDWFEPRYETPGRTFRLYRVRIPRR